jgi:hypothetical protein
MAGGAGGASREKAGYLISKAGIGILVKIIPGLIVLLMTVGCAWFREPAPNYFYNANENENDPVLIFTSDFALRTLFHVNIEPSSDNACVNFSYAGYIKNFDTIGGARGKQNKEIKIQVPADQVVTVRALYSLGPQHCGPLYRSFTPKKGATYRINMDVEPDRENGPRRSGDLLALLAVGAIGKGSYYSGNNSVRETHLTSPRASIFGGVYSGNLFGPQWSPPHGFCYLRITDDADNSIVQKVKWFKRCKPS